MSGRSVAIFAILITVLVSVKFEVISWNRFAVIISEGLEMKADLKPKTTPDFVFIFDIILSLEIQIFSDICIMVKRTMNVHNGTQSFVTLEELK